MFAAQRKHVQALRGRLCCACQSAKLDSRRSHHEMTVSTNILSCVWCPPEIPGNLVCLTFSSKMANNHSRTNSQIPMEIWPDCFASCSQRPGPSWRYVSQILSCWPGAQCFTGFVGRLNLQNSNQARSMTPILASSLLVHWISCALIFLTPPECEQWRSTWPTWLPHSFPSHNPWQCHRKGAGTGCWTTLPLRCMILRSRWRHQPCRQMDAA